VTVREELFDHDGVPTRLYRPDHANGVLLFGHGGEHTKDTENFVRLCRMYAERTGLAVVCIDAVDHGARQQTGASPGLPKEWHSKSTPQMVADWRKTAENLSSIGPAVAYVGFSMGMIFGAPTVASMPSIKAAVFGVGGIPTGPWIDDPPLRAMLMETASQLQNPEVLMLNMTKDELFRTEDTHLFFDAIPGRKKRLMFWENEHNNWPAEAIRHSVDFIIQNI
jgi:dienelactone hydrolase